MEKIYYDPRHPGSFGGIDNLARAAKTTRQRAKKFLQSQDVYTKSKPLVKNFPRRPFISFYTNELWQIDLMEMGADSKANRGVRFVLIIVDTFSRYVQFYPLKKKTGEAVSDALSKAFKIVAIPKLILCDRGKEFYNAKVKKLLDDNSVKLYSTYSEVKAGMAERYIRTLKNYVARYKAYSRKKYWVNKLQDFAYKINNSVHSRTGYKPVDVDNETPMPQPTFVRTKPTYSIGTFVRTSRKPKTFEKENVAKFGNEIFEIVEIRNTSPTTYKLQDLRGENILGSFYPHEFSRVILSK